MSREFTVDARLPDDPTLASFHAVSADEGSALDQGAPLDSAARTLFAAAASSDGPIAGAAKLGPNCTIRRRPTFRSSGPTLIANMAGGCTGMNFSYLGARILRMDPGLFDSDEELDEDKIDGPRRGIYTVQAMALCSTGRHQYKAKFMLNAPAPSGRSELYERELRRWKTCSGDEDPDQHPCLKDDAKYHAFTRSEFRWNLCVATGR